MTSYRQRPQKKINLLFIGTPDGLVGSHRARDKWLERK